MNLGVDDVFRLLGDVVYDVGMMVADYAVSYAPELEGLDVPLLALTADEARAMVDAARPILTGIGDCPSGDARLMTLVKVSQESFNSARYSRSRSAASMGRSGRA